MSKNAQLKDILNQFYAQGYRLADSSVAAMSNEAIQSNDWRLDQVQQVRNEHHRDSPAMVMAVSSATKGMRLLFVEVLYPGTEFSPVQLLKRLFPVRNRPAVRVSAR
ncbi:MAG: hypothetical protein SFV52_09820 [Saprospiraceae bacterium]|nr:hypothetical protein [Saprospiraceae bacterium]